MPQDQLTRNERIRLEALAQSVARHMSAGPNILPNTITSVARIFEEFIRAADVDHPQNG